MESAADVLAWVDDHYPDSELHRAVNEGMTKNEMIYQVFDKLVEGQLINPTFITGFPIDVSPLARRRDDNSELVDRFELFVNGWELANAFSELNDPVDQEERFKRQKQVPAKGDEEAMPYDLDYVYALEYGMPPTGGLGMGVDRLLMLMSNSDSIKEVIFFPHMRTAEAAPLEFGTPVPDESIVSKDENSAQKRRKGERSPAFNEDSRACIAAAPIWVGRGRTGSGGVGRVRS